MNISTRFVWLVACLICSSGAVSAQTVLSQSTYRVIAIGSGEGTSVATGVNDSGEVSGYTSTSETEARAWRFSMSNGLLWLNGFGGQETKASGINNKGAIVGYSRDAAGKAHGFLSRDSGMTDLGTWLEGYEVFAQALDDSGRVVGSVRRGEDEKPFFFSETSGWSGLGKLGDGTELTGGAAYALNSQGWITGLHTDSEGNHRAFRTRWVTGPGVVESLGVLADGDSWGWSIDATGTVVGSSTSVTGDTHAFRSRVGDSMLDLQTLGGFGSVAYGIQNSGWVLGSAENAQREPRAFLWSVETGMFDLNTLIRPDSGWVLTEARSMSGTGWIAGSGVYQGRTNAFLLQPVTGVDMQPPVAMAVVSNLTEVTYSAQVFTIRFWDDSGLILKDALTNGVRVVGPAGFDQEAVLYGLPKTNHAYEVVSTFYVNTPSGVWNGTNNGHYSIVLQEGTVTDGAGNGVTNQVVGSFEVITEQIPEAFASLNSAAFVNGSAAFTLNAHGSFPYAEDDVFSYELTWDGNSTVPEKISGNSGITVNHPVDSIGLHSLLVVAEDPHGVRSKPYVVPLFVSNPGRAAAWVAGPALTGNRRLAVGANLNGTILCLGGLPLKSSALQAQAWATGSGGFVDARRLNVATVGIGAGTDSLGRLIVYGGLNPKDSSATTQAFLYDPSSGQGAAVASMSVGVHDFGFCADADRRLYAVGGATLSGATSGTDVLQRYDAKNNQWKQLARLPMPLVGASAVSDGLGHILVMGGVNTALGQSNPQLLVYDISRDSWNVRSSIAPNIFGGVTGRAVALGADGLVYAVGGMQGTAPLADVWIYDPIQELWMQGPSLQNARGSAAIAINADGLLVVMGGDGPANGGGGGGSNGLSTTETLNTGLRFIPEITSTPFESVPLGSRWAYLIQSRGNPHAHYSLVSGPTGMEFDAEQATFGWTPTSDQVGQHRVVVLAENELGSSRQQFVITVTPPAGDTTPPTAPTEFFPVFRSSDSITFTWTGASDDLGVAGYRFYQLQGSRSRRWVLIADGITNRSYRFTGFSTSASFAVAAVDAAGNVSPLKTGTSAILTLPVIRHAVTTNVEPGQVIQGRAFIFTLRATALPGPGFQRLVGPDGMTLSQVLSTNANEAAAVVQWQASANDVGVHAFTVYATNANTSGSSATFQVEVLPGDTDQVAPTSVGRLAVQTIEDTRCTLVWTSAGDNVAVTSYLIHAVHFGTPTNHIVDINTGGVGTNLVLTGLIPAAGYSVSIRAMDAAGNVGAPVSIFFTTLVSPNLALHIEKVQDGELSLDWSALGAGWKATVEETDSLTRSNWHSLASELAWPTAATHVLMHAVPGATPHFYRLIPQPVAP